MSFETQFRFDYATIAASQTKQSLGDNGQKGDILDRVVIVPGTTAAGKVSVYDGSGSEINLFPGGGTTALTTLTPFVVQIKARSTSGAWQVTTGSNVTAIAVGRFT